MKRIITLALMMVVMASIHAQTYHLKLLQSVAEQLHLTDQLADTTLMQVSTADGRTLNVRFDGGQVRHIGIPLFNKDMRLLMPSPIYDFLELALLNHVYHISENMLPLQSIKFHSGSWQTLENVLPSDACNISNLDGKQYMVSWQRDSTEMVSLSFPINYELLANSSRREMEGMFIRDLKTHHPQSVPDTTVVDESQLDAYGSDSLYVLHGQSYLRPFMTRNTFYRLQPYTETVDSVVYEEERPVLVSDKRYPHETMANLLLNHSDCQLKLNLLHSDYRRDTINVSQKQWLSYCQKEGCTPYFAFEKNYDQEAAGIIIMHNPSNGYDHLLYLRCPLATMDAKCPTLTGNLYLYLPANNIKNLFADDIVETSNRKNTKK